MFEPACLHREGRAYRMRPATLAGLQRDGRDDLIEAFSDCGTFWVRRDGLAMPTQSFDNGADYFCHGLARYQLDGKYGYMNKKLEVVVPPSYDFAFPFNGAHGVVCADCRLQPDGEHTAVLCAHCGAVDPQGQLEAPLELPTPDVFRKYPGDCDP